MARIVASNPPSILKIKTFLGLNQSPDGDTNLRIGELSAMQNFKITRDKHLQIRPGTKTLLTLRTAWNTWAASQSSPVSNPKFCGSWYGKVGDAYHLIAAFGGAIFDVNIETSAVKAIGSCTQDTTTFFGFDSKVYLLNGHEYLCWDGKSSTTFKEVEPYVPVIMTATNNYGSGTKLENVNRLTNKRRVKFSPDGESAQLQLPEKNIGEVLEVKGTTATYELNAETGKLQFGKALPEGVNTITVTYTKGDGAADEVKKMHYSELFNGATDTRVFLYGDGSNKTIYSGVNSDTGKPDAGYFPDLFEASVGEANTPITAMVRHYSRLLVFKSASCWSMQYELTTLSDGALTAAFYVTPVNRQIGNAAPGQVLLLENSPMSLHEDSIYKWTATSSSGNITADNRNASRMSDRVSATLAAFDLSKTKTFSRMSETEYWFLYGGNALVLNYAADAWYYYSNVPFEQMVEISGETYGFREDGGIVHFSRLYRDDDAQEINAYAATGSMDFDKDWIEKYSPMIFVAVKPEDNARVYVTVKTNRRGEYPKKLVSANISSFRNVDFAHFSFITNRTPQVKRVKMKVKKATYYQLIFESVSTSATATIVGADIMLRYGGNVK